MSAPTLQASLPDTGWRDITGLLENGWTASPGHPGLRIRRIGALVSVQGEGLVPGTSTSLAVLPTGFKATGRAAASAYIGSGTLPIYGRAIGGAVQCNNTTSPAAWRDLTVNFFTTDPWPTVLPGLPA
ncbi:hypothetical protein GCM10011490_24360 [Pseudoclavibacter endophyticus]|uniref:Uncharacterized protein n=1 Tax=Pseudoclavibacter endophyticus TaxID=1778590 RepID=A0A6H9WJG5_9MICO|nr:hypothetical protein [Pseudoclavibacter endophyticus]KAB1647779.1 hypothetical protein F8O04_12185 [Pseudoclavibacter endophyticus]GGA72707.1 hypothetical protein GCM10011490_24360 [Pseudoclavibacter endophyticus]